MSGFKKAVRTQRPLRMAIYGPSGSGKSLTSLIIGRELVGPDGTIAMIDTERSSANVYAEGHDFDTATLTDYTHSDYITLIEQAKDYDVLIIDSISHAWDAKDGILDLVEMVTNSQKSAKKDSFRAWSDPRVRNAEDSLWDAVLSFPGHVIVTMRAKTAYERSIDDRGNTKIVKLGLEPRQRKGIEFEFDVIAEMDKEHWLEVDKARDPEGKLEGQRIHKPGVKFARLIKSWLDSGATPAEDYGKRIAAVCQEIAKLMDEDLLEIKRKAFAWIKLQYDTEDLSTIKNEDLALIPEKLMATFGPGAMEDQRQMRQGEEKAKT